MPFNIIDKYQKTMKPHTRRYIGIAILFLSVLIQSNTAAGQEIQLRKDSTKNIDLYYKQFLSQELKLSKNEISKFWPIYQSYQTKIRALQAEKKKHSGRMDMETDAILTESLNQRIHLIKKETELRIQLIEDLRRVLPDRIVIKLDMAEYKFRRRLLEKVHKMQKRKMKN